MAELSIIVAAFSNQKVTKAAVQRAVALAGTDGEVFVYRGTRRSTVTKVSDSATLIEERGPLGLIECINQSSHDTFLHLYDSIEIPPASVVAMREAFERHGGGKMILPWTNDEKVDHNHGPLPVKGNITKALMAKAKEHPEDLEAHYIRPSCVMASTSGMIGLARQHLAHPATTIDVLGDDAIIAANAIAANGAEINDLLMPPTGPEGRPLLVASMIVRDEEDFLEDCLKSLEGLVDRIDICDTGSTDRTIEIAQKYGANVIQREWRDDFAWARNETLSLSKDAWYCLWIDADERVIATDQDKDFIRRQLATSVDQFDMFAIGLGSPTGKSEFDAERLGQFVTPRIYKPDTAHFVNPLHEQLVARPGEDRALTTTRLAGMTLLHLGYTDEVLKSRDKGRRNVDISKKDYEENPDSPLAAFQYARSLDLAHKDAELRRELYKQADEGLGNDANHPAMSAFIKGLRAHTLLGLEEYEEALEVAKSGLDIVPKDDNCLHALGLAANELGQQDVLFEYADKRTTLMSVSPVISDPKTVVSIESLRAAAHASRGEITEALESALAILVVDPENFKDWDKLIQELLDNDPDHAMDHLQMLVAADPSGNVFNGLARKVNTALVAQWAADVSEAGRPSYGASKVGLTAAMVRQDWATFDRLVPFAEKLSEVELEALAWRARQLGHDAAANKLLGEDSAPAFII